MIQRLRLLLVISRPAVVILLGLFAATGLAQAGRPDDHVLLLEVLLVVAGFLLCSVVVNDLADEEIDRVNLPGDASRPLVVGACRRGVYLTMGVTAAAVALGGSLLLRPAAVVVVACGLALSFGYSVRPVRLADRGVVASLVLPAAYVAVPYLVGVFAVRPNLHARDLALLAGLYVGFIGRIVLKDFRDVRGDALFGKRTFLVRHGRRATCGFSAVCWAIGAVAVVAATGASLGVAVVYAVFVTVVLILLRRLATDPGARRDEALISAIAIVGRGMIVTLLGHLSTASPAVTITIAVIVLGAAKSMLERGPVSRLTVPHEWAQRSGSRNFSNSHHCSASYGASPHHALSLSSMPASAPCGDGR